jgi:hypothetical protein
MKNMCGKFIIAATLLGLASACAPNNGTHAAFRNYEYAPDNNFTAYPSANSGYYYNGYANNQSGGVFHMNNQH